MGKLKTIYMTLLHKDKKIMKKDEIIRVIQEYNKKIKKLNIKNALWYLSRRSCIKRIFLDYYYINSIDEKEMKICNYEDKELLFEVLNKEKVKWYLGLNSALYLLGKIWQAPNLLIIINNKISGKRRILGLNINFIKIKDNLIFGLLIGKTKRRIVYFYSNAPKTGLDFAYLKRGSVKLDGKNIKYIKKYPKWFQKLI